MLLAEITWLVIPSLLWGVTNPLIKKGSSGIELVSGNGLLSTAVLKFQFIVSKWKIFLPFFVNQLGSVAYFFALKSADVSVGVPVVNSLTLVITSLTGHLVAQEKYNLKTILGMLLIVSGVSLCVLDSLI